MNKILLIILINIIIIFGYKYKISLYILPFIFIIGSVLYIQLIYVKDKELLEGFNDEDVLSYWNQIEDTVDKDIETIEDNLINKIDSIVKLLTKLETSDNKMSGKQCEGGFQLTKSHKECGINAYDEYKYVISKQGDNCEYMPGYTYREEKELCKIDQECKDEGDCDKGAKCVKNKCKIGFECSSTELDNCNKEDCKKLNNEYGGFSYEFLNGKCTTSRCNVNEYFNCNSKDTCEGLGFNYKWDPKTLPRCQKKEEDVKTCSEIDCPDKSFPIISNKDKACRRPLNPGEKIDQFSKVVEINGKKYLDGCNTKVCCQPSYKCGQYFSKPSNSTPTFCEKYYNKISTDASPNEKCFSNNMVKSNKYGTYDLGTNSSGTIYYVDNKKWPVPDNKIYQSKQNSLCSDRDCSDCLTGVINPTTTPQLPKLCKDKTFIGTAKGRWGNYSNWLNNKPLNSGTSINDPCLTKYNIHNTCNNFVFSLPGSSTSSLKYIKCGNTTNTKYCSSYTSDKSSVCSNVSSPTTTPSNTGCTQKGGSKYCSDNIKKGYLCGTDGVCRNPCQSSKSCSRGPTWKVVLGSAACGDYFEDCPRGYHPTNCVYGWNAKIGDDCSNSTTNFIIDDNNPGVYCEYKNSIQSTGIGTDFKCLKTESYSDPDKGSFAPP